MIQSALKIFDAIQEKTGSIVSLFSLFLVLMVVADVLLRYLFNSSFIFMQELEWYFYSIIFLGGAGYTLNKDEHVRIDLIYSKYSAKNKLIVDIAGGIIFSLVFIISVIWVSTEFAIDSLLMGEISADPGGLPYRFVIKAVLPLGFMLLLIETISQILKATVKLREISGASKSD